MLSNSFGNAMTTKKIQKPEEQEGEGDEEDYHSCELRMNVGNTISWPE